MQRTVPADGQWASIGYSRSITDPRTLSRIGLRPWLRDRLNTVIFRLTLGFVDLAFWLQQLKQRELYPLWLVADMSSGFLPKDKREGWEDKLQHQFEQMAKEEFGVEIDDKVFLG